MLLIAAVAFLAESRTRLFACAVTILIYRIAYAFYDLPQNSLFGVLGAATAEHRRLAALRMFLSGLAILSITSTVAPLVAGDDTHQRRNIFLAMTMVMSAIALASAWTLRNTLHAFPAPAAPDRRRDLMPPLSINTTLGTLFGLSLVIPLTTSAFSQLEPYFVAYVLDSKLHAGALVMALALGSALSQSIWVRVPGRETSWRLLALAAAVLLLSSLLFLITARHHLMLAMAASFAFGTGSGGLGMGLWSGLGLALKGRNSAAGPIITASTSLSKGAGALGILLLGTVLHGLDYRARDSHCLLLLMTIWPAIGAVLCLLLLGLRRWLASSGTR